MKPEWGKCELSLCGSKYIVTLYHGKNAVIVMQFTFATLMPDGQYIAYNTALDWLENQVQPYHPDFSEDPNED